MLSCMKLIASKRARNSLPGDGAFDQLTEEGRGSLGGVSATNDRARVQHAAAFNGVQGTVESKGGVDVPKQALLIDEARYFLVEAMAAHDDRLARFAHRVLVWAVEHD